MPLMASIPHFYCFVRKEFFYDQEAHVGEFEEAAVTLQKVNPALLPCRS